MTTNGEWLFSKPFDEQVAWMHEEHQDGTLDGDTAALEAKDSREKLEDDVRVFSHHMYTSGEMYHKTLAFLDRQAAITANETSHDNPYVGLVRGKQWERTEISDYYCGSCGWKVTDHDSYCSECGGALHKAPNKPDGKFDAPKSVETSENPASKDEIRDFDVWSVAYEIYCAGGYVDNGNEPNPPTDGIRELLDRQAAITAEETSNAWEEYRDATQREIAKLTAERDELQERLNRTTSAMNSAAGKWARANEQCNEYREKFSKCLGYADAIHALMDDEGMA